MAEETIWLTPADIRGLPPEGWEMIHVELPSTFSHYLGMKEWCLVEENLGEFGVTPAISLPADRRTSGSLWAFSDPRTAFEFKLRFG